MKRIALLIMLFAMVFGLGAQSPQPYIVADFAETDLPKMLELCRQGGFERLVENHPFSTFGHYEWNPAFAPEGDISVKRMVKAAAEQGVTLGLIIQEEVVSLNDAFFAPDYFKQLQCSEPMRLFDDLSANEVDIAIRREESFNSLSTLNLLLIDDEMVSIGTMEFAGDLVLLHHCSRGLYGTKTTVHDVNSKVYKVLDTPDRFVLPKGDLLEQVRQQLASRLAEAEVPFTLVKDAPGQELLEESVRVRQVERWEQEGVANQNLGWFMVYAANKKRAATSVESLEWMLSKAAAFDASYGVLIETEAVKKHGSLNEMLELTRQWNLLSSHQAFNTVQKEMMKDPYLDWKLEKQLNPQFLLYPCNYSRRFQCSLQPVDTGLLSSETWMWNVEEEGRFGLRIQVDGEVEIINPMVNTPKGLVLFPCTIEPGQRLMYDFGETAVVVDANLNRLEEVTIEGLPELAKGENEVSFLCEVDPEVETLPVVRLRYITRETPFIVYPHY